MKTSGAFAIILLLGFATQRRATALQAAWNYTDQEAWKAVEDWECDGTRQSPINIITDDLVTSGALIELSLTNFDQTFSGNWSNNGHSVLFDPDAGLDTALFRNHLGTYKLLQFHFHWGGISSVGSEHQVDGQTYAGELHFVTKKTTGSDTAGDAFAVLGVLLVSDSSLPLTGSWMILNDAIPTGYQDISPVSGLQITDFMPSNLSYYHYEGSLTTPACSEVVQWFLLQNAVNVPSAFLDSLRTTVNGIDGETLGTNFRQPLLLNGRQVMIRGNSGSRLNLSASFLTIVATIAMYTVYHY